MRRNTSNIPLILVAIFGLVAMLPIYWFRMPRVFTGAAFLLKSRGAKTF